MPKEAQSAVHRALATGLYKAALYLVAVTPNDPAVPVDTDNVMVFTARMYFPEAAAGIKLFRGTSVAALRVAAKEMVVKFPVDPSL